MSGILRNGQRQNNFNRNYNNKFANNRQAPMRNGRFVKNPTVMNRGPGVKNTNAANGNGLNRDVVIRRNIEHMKLVAQKKRVAQERYYGQGQSPMVRTNTGAFGKPDPKGRLSVQNRLGNKSPGLRTNNTNSQNFAPRRNNQPFIGGLRSDKLIRVQGLQKKKQIRFQDAIKTISASGQVVYLPAGRHRAPNNYTVRVDNDHKPHYKHHVAKDLNPQLQQEIKLIQNKSMRQVMTAMPAPPPAPLPLAPSFDQIDRLPIVATSRTLHERFSMI